MNPEKKPLPGNLVTNLGRVLPRSLRMIGRNGRVRSGQVSRGGGKGRGGGGEGGGEGGVEREGAVATGGVAVRWGVVPPGVAAGGVAARGVAARGVELEGRSTVLEMGLDLGEPDGVAHSVLFAAGSHKTFSKAGTAP